MSVPMPIFIAVVILLLIAVGGILVLYTVAKDSAKDLSTLGKPQAPSSPERNDHIHTYTVPDPDPEIQPWGFDDQENFRDQ